MLRRDTTSIFAFVLLCLTVSQCFGGKTKRNAHDDKDAKVIVLGAGMSGISAATTLLEAGYKNIHVLEATDRIGGRVKQKKLGDYTVELGAMWVYGKGKNPVYHLVDKFNISTTDSYSDSWTVRDSDGQDVTEMADAFYEEFERILSEISKFAKISPKDFNMAGALKYFHWTNKSNIALAVESFIIDFELGVPPSMHSGKYLNLLEVFEDFESFDMLISNNENGFVNLIERLGERVTADDENRVLFNTVVTEIEYGIDSVLVRTRDGQTFEADFAIVTFSLGVLQRRQVEFKPQLPDLKQFAIDTFGFCSCTYIYLQFNDTFWDNTMYVIHANTFRGRNYIVLNINSLYPGSNILQFTILDAAAEWADSTKKSVVIAELVDSLQHIYPNATVPNPVDYVMSGWNLDPFTSGAWSYWPPSFTEEDMQNLKAPVGRLHFAGEYTHELHYGFLHSAYISGDRVAENIIDCIEYPTTCSNLGDWNERDRGNDVCTSSADGVIRTGSLITICMFVLANIYVFYN